MLRCKARYVFSASHSSCEAGAQPMTRSVGCSGSVASFKKKHSIGAKTGQEEIMCTPSGELVL